MHSTFELYLIMNYMGLIYNPIYIKLQLIIRVKHQNIHILNKNAPNVYRRKRLPKITNRMRMLDLRGQVLQFLTKNTHLVLAYIH